MNRPAARAILLALPFLALNFYVLTRVMPPLTGYAAGLAIYWVIVLVPLIYRHRLHLPPLRINWPGLWIGGAGLVMVAGVAGGAALAMAEVGPALPLILWLLIPLAALANGTLEELFWRASLLQDDASRQSQFVALGLFTGWHFALLFAQGISLTGGALALLAGAAAVGGIATLARMRTRSLGYAITFHVGLNVFAFTELTLRNVDKL